MHRKFLNSPYAIITTIALLAATTLAVFTLALPARAQSSSESGQALEIGPPVVNLEGDPGDTLQATINLRNISNDTIAVTNEINDFTSDPDKEDGTPKILFDDEENPFSIKSWISPISSLTLESKETTEIDVSITIPGNAEPGGYYGIVRFSGVPVDMDTTGVSLSASLGSLIFINVSGDAKEALSLEDFYVGKDESKGSIFEKTPITFTERLKNDGNTYEQPAGTVTIKDMFKNTVATLGVNQPIRTILPDSTRKFDQPLDETVIGNKVLFGYYTATLEVTYGSNDQTLTGETSFWIIPYRLIILGLGVLVAAFFGLKFLLSRYNQHVLNRAGGGHRRGSSRRRR